MLVYWKVPVSTCFNLSRFTNFTNTDDFEEKSRHDFSCSSDMGFCKYCMALPCTLNATMASSSGAGSDWI